MTLSQKFSKNLRRERLLRDLSQERLAEKAMLSVSFISMLERGKRSPPLDTLEKLAAALGIQATKLLAA